MHLKILRKGKVYKGFKKFLVMDRKEGRKQGNKRSKILKFIAGLTERFSRGYGDEIVERYRTILNYDLSERNSLPSREEVWPISRLAKEYVGKVFPDYHGDIGIPIAAVRLVLKNELPAEEQASIGELYQSWNGKRTMRDIVQKFDEKTRTQWASDASKASLQARSMRRWEEEEVARVFQLAQSGDSSYIYHGHVNLRAIAQDVGRTREAVRTCLRKPKNKSRYGERNRDVAGI